MDTRLRPLTTIDEVLAALGGDAAVARLTGRGRQSISNWRRRRGFPPVTFLVLREALKKRGWSAPEGLWGMEAEKPARAKPRAKAHAEVAEVA